MEQLLDEVITEVVVESKNNTVEVHKGILAVGIAATAGIGTGIGMLITKRRFEKEKEELEQKTEAFMKSILGEDYDLEDLEDIIIGRAEQDEVIKKGKK